MAANEKLFLTVRKTGSWVASHTLSTKEPSFDLPAYQELEEASPPVQSLVDAADFPSVLKAFKASIDLYLKFIPLTLSAIPYASKMLSTRNLEEFLGKKARKRDDLSSGNLAVYEFDREAFHAFKLCEEEITTMISGVQEIPKTMLIGLISAYDFHLSRLLRVVLNTHPEIVFTSDRNIKFSELTEFATIEDAREAIIEREIDAVMRYSHSDQFEWMESRLNLSLRKGLAVWPVFVELCERRNLFTHTGGLISAQYMKNCKDAKCKVSNLKIGDRLDVDTEYFATSVRAVYEIGAKLIYVLWRKFKKEEGDRADEALNQLCFDLIYREAYLLSESLLTFGAQTMKTYAGNDRIRRMMIVNLANALLLQKRPEESKKILEEEDWSAANDEFKVCIAAVSGEVDETIAIMRRIGRASTPTSENYRTWPVFREISKKPKFIDTFEEIFETSFVNIASVEEVNSMAESIDETKH